MTVSIIGSAMNQRVLTPSDFICRDLTNKNHRVLPVILVGSIPRGQPQGVGTLWFVAGWLRVIPQWSHQKKTQVPPVNVLKGTYSLGFSCLDLTNKNHRVVLVIVVGSIPTGRPQTLPFGPLPVGLPQKATIRWHQPNLLPECVDPLNSKGRQGVRWLNFSGHI